MLPSNKDTRFIFVTGGVCSSLGKGITAASIATLLLDRGFEVAIIKLDPYLNVDAGTMNPSQHGEVFVTEDGYEADMDLGHYERFTGIPTSRGSNVTSGQVYESLLARERHGSFLGSTIQVIPHLTAEIRSKIAEYADEKRADVVIVEIGGTTGDIEGQPFLEAINVFREKEHDGLAAFVHLTYLPYIKAAGELKTKPTQHSVRALRESGIVPDFLVCRSEEPMTIEHKKKLKDFCAIKNLDRIIEARDMDSVYAIPESYREQRFDEQIMEVLGLVDPPSTDNGKLMKRWAAFNKKRKACEKERWLQIGIVGKYDTQDAYACVEESIRLACYNEQINCKIERIESSKINKKSVASMIGQLDGVVVPGGFGPRGFEGKVVAAQYCREQNIPFLGLCLGMQVLVVEFARNVANMKGANSTEMDASTPYPVISLMAEQKSRMNLGGSMRLGSYAASVDTNTNAGACYGVETIFERHRHRYEVNSEYVEALEQAGLKIVARSVKGGLVEAVEVAGDVWHVGCQYHPEFKSTPLEPHPLFLGMVRGIKKSIGV